MPIKKPSVTSHRLVTLCAAYVTLALNWSFWSYIFRNLEITGAATALFALSLPLLTFTLCYALFSLLAWRRACKPVIISLFLLAAATDYFMYRYGVYIDKDMLRNVLQTDPAEVRDLVTIDGVAHVVVFGLLPSLLVLWTDVRSVPFLREAKQRLKGVALCLAFFAVCAGVTFKEYVVFGRNHKRVVKLLNPVNSIGAAVDYAQKRFAAPKTFVTLDEKARHAPFPDENITVFIMVLGEAARAENFSLNGYARKTNPRLSAEDIVNFPDVASAGTATAFSVPAIFSPKPRKDFDPEKAAYSENLLDLLKRSGYNVLWRENNSGCKGVCARVPTETTDKNNPAYCDGSYCYDEILLEGLEDYLRGLTKDTFIVLHTIGSHGPAYYKRYPDAYRQFDPTCDTGEIQSCPRESIVNTYDNSILYADAVVAKTIGILRKFPQFEAGLLYVSDHGESLGENGLYLHGLPYGIAPDTQKKIPMVLWMSDVMREEDHIDYDCLKKYAATGSFSHDNLFHSLAGLMEINTWLYEERLDLFKTCRTKELPD